MLCIGWWELPLLKMSKVERVNKLITNQNTQQETIVHIKSILNITQYTTQFNHQHINIVMNTVHRTLQDINNLYNDTTSLYTSLSYHQLILYFWLVLANLWDFLSHTRADSINTMDYVDATTIGILSPHTLPITDLKKMSEHIEETLPSGMHVPV